MTLIDQNPDAREARRLRQRLAIDQLDYRRVLQRLSELSVPQRELSAYLGISQPTLSKTLVTAERTPRPRPGFSGAYPYEIAQRYAAGALSREQVIDELTRWEYEPPAASTDGFDSLMVPVSGSVDDLVRAFRDGLLEGDVYDEILVAVSEAAS